MPAPQGLNVRQLATIGWMVTTYSLADDLVNQSLGLLKAPPPTQTAEGLQWQVPQDHYQVFENRGKLGQMKKLASARRDHQLLHLVNELRAAMTRASKVRQFLAHGRLLQAEDGAFSFWSQRRLKELSLNDALAAAPWFDYAKDAGHHVIWRCMGVDPPAPMPPRPA
jgi:hypothetical protein